MRWIDSIPLPALRIDARGRIVEANGLAAKRFERPPRALVRADASKLGDPACEIPLRDGRLLLYSDGNLIERLQQQVYHLSRLASAEKIVAVVVHEINNALSGILGYTQFLLAQPLAPEPRRDLQRINDEALRTARVVQNLLRFSRTGTGEKTTVQLADLLQRCAELKRRDFALRSIELVLEIVPNLPPLEADEALLSQVFINLLTNAQQGISSVRNHGCVRVRARQTRGRLVVDVDDDGPGIPVELRERVFEPFYTSRVDGSGTGLGLTLCRDILRDHGADIRVAAGSRTGACLRVSFPVSARAREPLRNDPPRPAAEPLSNRRIVVVEDEPALRDVVTRTFAGNGNHIIAFERGEDAVPFLASEPVDLIVSDIHRPGLDGIELYEHLARTQPALVRRMLFITGDTLDLETASFLRRAHAPHLTKPLLLDDLKREARAILDRPSQQGELFTAAS